MTSKDVQTPRRQFMAGILTCMVIVNTVITWAVFMRLSSLMSYLQEKHEGHGLPYLTRFLLGAATLRVPLVALVLSTLGLLTFPRLTLTKSSTRIFVLLAVVMLAIATVSLLFLFVFGQMDVFRVLNDQ